MSKLKNLEVHFRTLDKRLEGELLWDNIYKMLYATDASVYRHYPLGVAYPKSVKDIQLLVSFASEHHITLIPRTAGTSLAGQCVGDGLVVDVSRYFTGILELSLEDKTVTVEPGVIRDELNQHLQSHELFFGPNTSTSNRCMIGGMVGNNSSGTTSLKYGVTRDKVLAVEVVLSDGSVTWFKPESKKGVEEKIEQSGLEGQIYKTLVSMLSDAEVQHEIHSSMPKLDIHRRNTGYALDSLLSMQPFALQGTSLNLAKLICGSEGTLGFITKIMLALDPLPPKERVMVVPHFKTIKDCCSIVEGLVKQHDLYSCEMIDDIILDCTKQNPTQNKNRFFIQGSPKAILMLELRSNDKTDLKEQEKALLATLEASNISYVYPVLHGKAVEQAEILRKSGLGVLSNMKGDIKPVACIEDTAVALEDLSSYIDDFERILNQYNQHVVYYGHAGAGELHLRPLLNLKHQEGVADFRAITHAVAQLVKSYKGSLSGEHGDGRVRSEFIKMMVGDFVCNLFKDVKSLFDPQNIFNAGKIVDPVAMDTDLRYVPNRPSLPIKTLMDFSDTSGILRMAEQCNGSGDCRKTYHAKGVMCPSYHVTKSEKDTTRGRANVFREVLTHTHQAKNRFDSADLKDVLDLCLSCKACSSECPSNVDMATLKTEFLYHYKMANGYTLQDRLFGFTHLINRWASTMPRLVNHLYTNKLWSSTIKRLFHIAPQRSLPLLDVFKAPETYKGKSTKGKVLLFVDEFSAYLDGNIAQDAYDLLLGLGYEVKLFKGNSGRALLSTGYLKVAQKLAEYNIKTLAQWEDVPILGIEPSAILTFRDEYIRLAKDQTAAKKLKARTFLVEEFLADEINKDRVSSDSFHNEEKQVYVHIHCHQKALSQIDCTLNILKLPKNYSVHLIDSGCCGMAGSFGYQKKHYKLSEGVAELKLFPQLRTLSSEAVVVANGTSCRHQIKDGLQLGSFHPVTILRQALIN